MSAAPPFLFFAGWKYVPFVELGQIKSPTTTGDFLKDPFNLVAVPAVSQHLHVRLLENWDVVAIIGDSTFFHSGLTGLVNAIHNNHNFTLVILDNATTAMTGHQPPWCRYAEP